MKIQFIAALTVLAVVAHAQENMLPKVIPPSPETASLGKYSEITTSLYTGNPGIGIPLFTTQNQSHPVSVSLSYSGTGIRVSEEPSRVGLGFTLNAGGAITRVVRGLPDESGWGYFSTSAAFPMAKAGWTSGLTDSEYAFVEQIAWGQLDAEPDVYSFNFMGVSGKFFYDEDGNWQCTNNADLKITSPLTESGDEWTVTDNKGTVYYFGSTSNSREFSSTTVEDVHGFLTYPTGWYLTKIKFADGSSDVTFSYSSPLSYSFTLSVQQTTNYIVSTSSPTFNGLVTRSITQGVISPVLSSIDLPNETINFTYGSTSAVRGGKYLSKIARYSKSAAQDIQSFQFTYSTTGRFKLTEVTEYSASNAAGKKYQLYYNATALPEFDSFAQDHYGFYNGASNLTLIPYLAYPFQDSIHCANRNVNPAVIAAESLIKIVYPTGGSTEYQYEAHSYVDSFSLDSIFIGGIRVKRIKIDDGNGTIQTKRYEYLNPYVYQPIPNGAAFYSYTYTTVPGSCVGSSTPTTYTVLTSGNNFSYGGWGSDLIAYGKVITYDGESGEKGKTISYFTEAEVSSGTGFPFAPGAVRDAQGGLLLKEEVYSASSILIHSIINEYDVTERSHVYGFKAGFLTDYTCWDATNLGRTYDLLAVTSFGIYSQWVTLKKTTERSMATGSSSVYTETVKNFYYNNTVHRNVTREQSVDSKGNEYNSYTLYPGDYAAGTTFINDMITNHQTALPIEQVTCVTNGSGTFAVSGQLTEYNAGGKGLINKIWVAKIDAPTPLSGFKFSNTAAGVLPFSTTAGSFSKDSRYESRVQFNAYTSRGKVLNVTPVDAPPTSYQWGYSDQYPIAETKNSANDQFYHHNFEESLGFGSGMVRDTTRRHTGKYSGKIENGGSGEVYIFSSTWLTFTAGSIKKMRYSVWVYSTGPSSEIFLMMKRAGELGYPPYFHNTGSMVTGRWVLLEGVADVPSDAAEFNLRVDNNSAGTVWYDDLRMCPADAEMTTYTYEPLVGMTSQSDGRNKATYYDYDSFQRLIAIKDQDGNPVKTFSYHYKN
ncbi:hypothetical protein [Hufsiella ginkgonis]|uniref:YD repeat-containing protein n=1 Tax=Hufsiella ginkgonis TaxID=2695274 RepID=A0A7K1Y354_9SPHI|nr:hypothetical protein [Hufsiella ginkgonis]MXV17715.1 hypothetical protein [Hufsiella ginkgonis]